MYDAASRLTSAVDTNSDYAYAYNADDQVTSVDNSGTPNVPHVVLVDGYDNLGRRTSLSATVAGTADFMDKFAYDALDRETQVTQQSQTGGNAVAAKRVDLAYNGDSQFTTISRYADLTGTNLVATSTYGYNGKGAITSLSHDKGATNLAAYTWGYDAMGRLTSTSSPDGTDAFTYDSASQVTAATHSYQANEAYSYDANGNRTNTGYTTGTNNRLTSDGTYNYTYDAEGNRTRQTAISGGAYTTFTWDFHNRLTDVSNYTSAGVLTKHVHYTYDVYDRLIGKQLDPTGGGTYTSAQWFAYDDNSASPPSQGGAGGVGSTGSAASNIVFAFNNSGAMTHRLLSGPTVDQPLADENASGTVSWLLPDNQGTIRDVAQYNSGTNTTAIVDHLKFDSFGNITAQSNSANQPLFGFTGRVFDRDTGLQYNRARWYDPKDGRFISEDPTGFGGGDINLSRYVSNAPTDFVDPTGLKKKGGRPNSGGSYGPPGAPPELQKLMDKMVPPIEKDVMGPVDYFATGGGFRSWWQKIFGPNVRYSGGLHVEAGGPGLKDVDISGGAQVTFGNPGEKPTKAGDLYPDPDDLPPPFPPYPPGSPPEREPGELSGGAPPGSPPMPPPRAPSQPPPGSPPPGPPARSGGSPPGSPPGSQ